jgi:acyl carrier protein
MENLSPDSMIQLLVTDSKHVINFVILLEDEFNIEIDDENINHSFFESMSTPKTLLWLSYPLSQGL